MADDKKKELYSVAQAIVKYIEKADARVVLPGAPSKKNIAISERVDLIENSK